MIVSVGESLIDFTPLEERGRTTGFRLHPGGSPFNVAVGVARLEHASGFAGRFSSDLFGRLLAGRLEADGVDLRLASTGPEPTTLAFVAFERGEAVYDFRVRGTAALELRPDDLRADGFSGVEALHFGSVALALEPAASTVLGLARALKGRVTLSLDPNLRPALVEDGRVYGERLRAAAGLADLVKVSEADLEAWDGAGPEDLLELGPVAVAVTHGGRGSVLHGDGLSVECPPAPCRVVDTVGAGDAFQSGLLVALAGRGALSREGMAGLDAPAWLEVLRFASVTAALTCERAGADPPSRAAVEEALAAWR